MRALYPKTLRNTTPSAAALAHFYGGEMIEKKI